MLLNELYQNLIPYQKAKRWIIGFSGGMDSTVLLHLLAKLKTQYDLPALSAIHIHHGLQAIADTWPAHCQTVCDQLNIPLTVIKVSIHKQASIEQAAREARYQAFTGLLQTDDVLLTAQHKNDQAETLLFRLFRGAGVRGLGAIPKQRSLGQGTLIRPLLNIAYNDLKSYAENNQLHWIEDPSNKDTHYARNYLRHNIVPSITSYWPQAIHNIVQTSEHMQEAQQLLNELAQQDLTPAYTPPIYPWLDIPCLSIKPLKALSKERQKNALAFWLANKTLQPTAQHWQGWFDFINAKETANPIWQLHHAEMHRSHDRIWLLKNEWLISPKPTHIPIHNADTITLPNNGIVKLSGKIPQGSLSITYRQGGESISLPNRGSKTLKNLFNETAIPHFLRQRLPLLVDQQGKILAIANFSQWVNHEHSNDFTFEWVIPLFNG